MSNIKVFSLGGLDELGKNCYIVEINNDIFVFDCGLKYANENLYGIDYIIPDFDYLIENQKRIKGVFLTHGHYENMGAIKDLLIDIPNIKIFATRFTKFVLTNDGVDEKKIIEIKPHRKINFGEVSIFPINVNHSAPDAVMYVINTKDGAIVYSGDFIIDPKMMDKFSMDLGKIAYIGKQGVLALLCESVFSERVGHTSPSHRLTNVFKDALKHNENRMIFSVLPTHIFTIQEILNAVENTHRKVVIMGKNLQNIISFCKKEGYLKFSDGLLGDLSNIDDKDSVLLIQDNKENPYASISKIINGYDKFIKLKPTDTVVFAEPSYDASEKTLVKVQNDLATCGCSIVSVPKNKTILHHASSEDLMIMIDLIKPKYYIPVKGEYRDMVNAANIASELNMPAENIILKQNGDVIEFNNGELNKENFDHIKINDVLIDGNSTEDVGELVIKDREMLSENGIVLISATISKKEKVLLVGPEVTTRGFIYVKDSGEMIEEIKKISGAIIERNITDSYIEFNKIKNEIREELGKYLYHETECKPMIIAVVQEV